jgi:hypothetical protein
MNLRKPRELLYPTALILSAGMITLVTLIATSGNRERAERIVLSILLIVASAFMTWLLGPRITSFFAKQNMKATRRNLSKEVQCSSCNQPLPVILKDLICNGVQVNCSKCNRTTIASIRKGRISIRVKPYTKADINEALIQQVKEMLPPEPWPPGVAKQTRLKLKTSRGAMKAVFAELTKRGDLSPPI